MGGVDYMFSTTSFSDMKATAVVFAITLVVLKLAMSINKKKYKLPPGPLGLPLVGYLPFFGAEFPANFTQMRKKYGDVISITMGSWPAIVINGRDAITEALVTRGDDFSGRPAFLTSRLLNEGRNFSFSLFGPIWKAHRKIAINVLRTFTNTRNKPIEDVIRSEAETVAQEFLDHGKKSFCPLVSLEVASSSMVYQLLYGTKTDIRNDEEFIKRLNGSRQFEEFNGAGNPVDVIPWLRFIMPGTVSKYAKFLREGVDARIKRVIEHESTFDDANLRDITDGLIHVGNNLSEKEKGVGMDKNRVIETLDTIFGAGGSTTTAALQWFVILMAAHPDVQERLFQQVIREVGKDREATMADRSRLPLVEATMYEILRYASCVPFGLPHSTTCDTTLQGFDIPEGTVVLVNLYSIHMDEKLWGDPSAFRPERFLDSEGQMDRGLTEQVSVFSLGRRRCPGETLARMEIFLFLTTFLQRIMVSKPPGQPDYVFKSHFVLTHELEPYDVCVSQRN